MNATRNLYDPIRAEKGREAFETLLQTDDFRLERIVSEGQATPKGEWFDQEQDEWVVLLRGSAGLLIEGKAETIVLGPGDYLLLPAHQRHRVEWTSENEKTYWLALHYPGTQPGD